MKFTRIELENIFAYSGEVTLDVSETSDEKNIILVWGRNGMGKTSLLNAVKLLFLGVGNRNLRSIGFPRRTLAPRTYVLGDGSSWSGIINRRAYQENPDVIARVKVVWEADGNVVSAERQWRRHGASFRESLVVEDGHSRLTAAAAEQRLASFLPGDFVDFFFFDGEEIKSLAEMAEGRKAVDFDQVLRISFVSELANEVYRMSRERGRALLDESLREEIAATEAEIRKAEEIEMAADESIVRGEEELIDCRRKQTQLLARRENLRSGASSAEREELQLRKDRLQERVRELTGEISRVIPGVAPMAANPGLVGAAIAELDERSNGGSIVEEGLVARIKRALPSWLAVGPPRLEERTRTLIAAKVASKLDELIEPKPSGRLFSNLNLERANRVRETLLRFMSSDRRRAHYQLLLSTHRARVELQSVTEALMELAVGSESTTSEYRDITQKLERVEDRIDAVNQDIGQHKRRMLDAQATLDRKRRELDRLEGKSAQATSDSRHVAYVGRVTRTLNDLREELRRQMREQVEELINEKFRILVRHHQLIHSIELDETYTLVFRDRGGRTVGRSSLSSGIKQLAATALLWAMKEVPEYEVPVIIDTPLGRIDRENQENMLRNYYPNLAGQVIIMPTNAEIDDRKFDSIRHRVAKQYCIRNDSGDAASVVVGSLAGGGA